MNYRHGKSLLELLAVIAAVSMMMLVTARMFHLLLRAEGTGATSLAASNSLARLGRQFRSDVHAALDARTADEGRPRLELTLPDGRQVLYTADETAITRTVRRGDERQAGETYRLPQGETRFETSAESGLVALIHVRQHVAATDRPAGATSRREFRVEAVRGRDHRFVASTPGVKS